MEKNIPITHRVDLTPHAGQVLDSFTSAAIMDAMTAGDARALMHLRQMYHCIRNNRSERVITQLSVCGFVLTSLTEDQRQLLRDEDGKPIYKASPYTRHLAEAVMDEVVTEILSNFPPDPDACTANRLRYYLEFLDQLRWVLALFVYADNATNSTRLELYRIVQLYKEAAVIYDKQTNSPDKA